MKKVSKQEEDAFFNDLEDFSKFAPEYLKIKTEEGEIVPFEFNEAQVKFNNLWEKTRKEGKKLWFIILKCRQVGISTNGQGRIYHHNFINPNQKSLTVGHKIDASNNLFDMYERYHNNLPDWMRPQLDKSNEKKISFKKLGSENKVDTAAGGEVGRSDNYQAVHLTEYAFYPDPKQMYAGLAQCAKKAKIFLIESTANGFNDFRDKWVDAINGESDFIPFFFSWLEFSSYSFPFDNPEMKQRFIESMGTDPKFNDYDLEEFDLMRKHKATLGQLNWRRWAIKNLCNNEVKTFHQEYPTIWQEAFLSSGRPVFNLNICMKRFNEAVSPLKRGNLFYTDPEKTKVRFDEDPNGFISLFDEVKVESYETNVFSGGGDVAEGLEQGDYSELRYMDRRTKKIVLTWHGHIDPELLADEQKKIQIFLHNKVYICTEQNNHGLTTITRAFNIGVNQYYRSDFRKGYDTPKDAIGFKTNILTKPQIIDMLNEAIREDFIHDPELEFWDQTLTFVKEPNGQGMGAQGKQKNPGVKCFDDRVMAEALMLECNRWMPGYFNNIPVNLNDIARPSVVENKPVDPQYVF